MEPADLIVLTTVLTLGFVVGISLNMNILLVYIGNLRNGISLGPADRVHLTKALLNVSMHVMMTAHCIIFCFWPYLLLTNEVFLSITTIILFLFTFNYWLTAVLCVYYCTNITNCGHHIFVWLKRSLSSYLLHIFLVSGLISAAITIPIFWFCSTTPAGNNTYQSVIIRETFLQNINYRTIAMILGIFLPFTISFVSTTVTSWSLISHICRMKLNIQGFTLSNLQPQINATRTMILLLLIFVIYNIVHISLTALPPNASDTVVMLSWIVLMSYPTSEAIVIIQSSSKLRSALLTKFCDRKRGNNEVET